MKERGTLSQNLWTLGLILLVYGFGLGIGMFIGLEGSVKQDEVQENISHDHILQPESYSSYINWTNASSLRFAEPNYTTYSIELNYDEVLWTNKTDAIVVATNNKTYVLFEMPIGGWK